MKISLLTWLLLIFYLLCIRTNGENHCNPDEVRRIDFPASRPETDSQGIMTKGGSQGGAFTPAGGGWESSKGNMNN